MIDKPEIILIICSTLPDHDEANYEDAETEWVQKVSPCFCYLTNDSLMQLSHSFSLLENTFMKAEGFNAEKHVAFVRKSMDNVVVEYLKDFALF